MWFVYPVRRSIPTLLLDRYFDSPWNSYRLVFQRFIRFNTINVVLTPGEYEMMPRAMPALNFNTAVLIFKFRIAAFTSKLTLAIICQKFVDWNSQSPKAFEGVLLAFNCN